MGKDRFNLKNPALNRIRTSVNGALGRESQALRLLPGIRVSSVHLVGWAPKSSTSSTSQVASCHGEYSSSIQMILDSDLLLIDTTFSSL